MKQRLAALAFLATLAHAATAQGTKLWTVDRYDDFAKGTAGGVAIRSDGRLEPGLATAPLYTTGGSYVWSLATDAAGNAYAGLGGTAGGSAVVMKVSPTGKANKLFEAKELGVQALRVLADGTLLAATSPDGKLYRVPTSGGAAAVLFDPAATEEKPKYLWDIAIIGQTAFVAAGAPATVYRIPLGTEKPSLLFKTTDQHIRCLLATPDGTLWAGSDGSGVVYRIKPTDPSAKPFAVYTAPKREITALTVDAEGNVYAAAVGSKGPSTLPPLPVTGNLGVSITFVQPASSTAANTNTILPDGSDIYRIGARGAPSKLLTLKDDIVYALSVRSGALLAATGNRGRVYKVDTAIPGRFTDLAHLEAGQATAFAPTPDGLIVATSNSGKLFRLGDRLAAPAVYTSTVFDAQNFAHWGRAEARSTAPLSLEARSGNTESPLMGWSDWTKVAPDAPTLGVPAARFVQWRATLSRGAALDAVAVNYLPSNIAPVVDEVVVQPGARLAPNFNQPQTTVQIAFPPAAVTPQLTFQPDPNANPLTAQKDRTAVTVRWAAHDDNGDDLMFAVFYKSPAESNWHLLKDKITDRFLSFDAALLPDGAYLLKVSASDAPVHADADTLKAEKVSDLFILDTTPPVPGPLIVTLEGSAIHVRLDARDATSPIAHAEYSLDASPWQYLEPVGKLSDALTEHYDFLAPIPIVATPATDSKEHLIAIRVYDRYENGASVKAVVR